MYLSQRRTIFALLSKISCAISVLVFALCTLSNAQDKLTQNAVDVTQKLAGFEAFMEKTLKDWNAPGIGVGVVVGDKLVFAKGYGFRDYEKKLPVTPQTMFTIASNTKLFTAVAAGKLVGERKITWDRPIKGNVPTVEVYNTDLYKNNTFSEQLFDPTGRHRPSS